jgi:small subunit ribosomal protein S6
LELPQPVSPAHPWTKISFLQRSPIWAQTPIFAAPLSIFERDPNLFRQISRAKPRDPLVKPDLSFKNHLMSNYELMVIFTPVLSDEEFKGEQKRYASLVKDGGGSIVAENAWGLKSLAYPIRKKTTGLYWVVEFTAQSEFHEKLKVQLLRDENVLRHLVTRLDKYAVEYNQKKRSGVPTGTEKVVEA